MVNITNNQIRPKSTGAASTPRRVAGKDVSAPEVERDELMPPPRRGFLSAPNEDVLALLIERALKALKHGIFWDRGSILNLLV